MVLGYCSLKHTHVYICLLFVIMYCFSLQSMENWGLPFFPGIGSETNRNISSAQSDNLPDYDLERLRLIMEEELRTQSHNLANDNDDYNLERFTSEMEKLKAQYLNSVKHDSFLDSWCSKVKEGAQRIIEERMTQHRNLSNYDLDVENLRRSSDVFGNKIPLPRIDKAKSAPRNQQLEQNNASLFKAVESNDVEKLLAVLKLEVDINAKKGWFSISTPLQKAAVKGNLEIVKFLVQAKADGSGTKDNRQIALYLAYKAGKTQVVEYLAGVELFDAIEVADLEKAARMLTIGAEVNAENINGITPMQRAIYKALRAGSADFSKYIAIVILLLKHGGDINKYHHFFGDTPLHWAAEQGHLEIVRLLVEKGANINSVDDEGYTAWGRASKNGFKNVAEFLEQKASDQMFGSRFLLEDAKNQNLTKIFQNLFSSYIFDNSAFTEDVEPTRQHNTDYSDMPSLVIEENRVVLSDNHVNDSKSHAEDTKKQQLHRQNRRRYWKILAERFQNPAFTEDVEPTQQHMCEEKAKDKVKENEEPEQIDGESIVYRGIHDQQFDAKSQNLTETFQNSAPTDVEEPTQQHSWEEKGKDKVIEVREPEQTDNEDYTSLPQLVGEKQVVLSDDYKNDLKSHFEKTEKQNLAEICQKTSLDYVEPEQLENDDVYRKLIEHLIEMIESKIQEIEREEELVNGIKKGEELAGHIKNGAEEKAKELLVFVDANYVSIKYELPLLFIAIADACTSVVKELLNRGAKVDNIFVKMVTFYSQARTLDHCKPRRWLVQQRQGHITGWTPLHAAALVGYNDLFEAVLEKAKIKEPKDSAGNTPLQIAQLYGRHNIILFLKKHSSLNM